MSARVWLLALATFVTGLAENITVGILPALAEGLQTPLGVAGQFTTVFSLSFATAAPLASRFASRWELRRLLCAALGFFIACNLAAALAKAMRCCWPRAWAGAACSQVWPCWPASC